MKKNSKNWGYYYYNPGYFQTYVSTGYTFDEATHELSESLKDINGNPVKNGYGNVFYIPNNDEVE